MQMHRSRAGLLAAALVSAAATVVSLGGVTGPVVAATGASSAIVGPGTLLVTGGRACTANFVFRDARHRLYVGYAASCATRREAAAGDPCSARSLPRGTVVRLADGLRTLGHGELGYSSLRALHRAGVSDAATCAANDFALVRIRGALRRQVDAEMPYWGGPSGLGVLPAAGTTVFGLFRPSPGARTLPRAGHVTATVGGTATVTTPLASSRAARGSGFLDDAGRAAGILTASTPGGQNTVVSLADAVAFARSHGVAGLHLVAGRSAFSGSAIL